MRILRLSTVTVCLAGLALPCDAVAQPKRELMQDAHTLVFQHASVKRSVEKLPNGVRTTTTTTDATLLPVLRQHPRQMGELYRTGGMVRGWDPLFRELAAVSDNVAMEVKEIDQGVEVVVTSDDAEVVKLIHAHADKVSDMVKRGVPAMHEATPLPPGYRSQRQADKSSVGDVGPAETLWDGKLVQFGTMHEAIGMQQHQGRVALKDLHDRPHFWGVGALAGLQGEISILDGKVTIARVNDRGEVAPLETSPDAESATLLVGASVPAWNEHTTNEAVTPEHLDQFLGRMAENAGLGASQPFVFRLDGDFTAVRLHVIHGACPMHARRRKTELPADQRPFEAELDRVQGAIVGVFAKNAVGQLTHPDTSVHMHLVYKDPVSGKQITGHVEQLGVATGAVLRLPRTR